MTGLEKLARLKSGHIRLVQALFDEAYACGHKDGRADAEEVATMLEAARRGPVVEWRKFLEYERASCGAFRLVVHGGGWYLTAQGLERAATVDSGEETGPKGKAACEAAYRKAAGL